MSKVVTHSVNYLDELESESIHILREVAGQFERPALLFSGGKDSITLVHLALKAFRPGKFPVPLVHIDTGHNFPEALSFRDELAAKIGETLIVRQVADTIRTRQLTEPGGKFASRNALQTFTLLDTIEEFGFDACIGGARRDEEKARAKERIFSVRDEFGGWDPKRQRPELWNTPSATGQNSISGIISAAKRSTCLPSISRTNARSSTMRDSGWRFRPLSGWTPATGYNGGRSVTAP
jgi:sulfate adenylyltransferase subunit 2